MKPFRSLFLRSIRIFAAMAIAMVTSTGVANAAFVTFTVDESAVGGGSAPDVFQANGITGRYREQVILDTDAGTFSGNLIVNFTNYTLGAVGAGEQLTGTRALGGENAANMDRYNLYAFVSVNGTFTATPGTVPGQTVFSFLLDNGQADVFIDPNRNTLKDLATLTTTGGAADDKQVLTASQINTNPDRSFGNVIVAGANQVVTGSYALVFTDPTLVDVGPTYWPSLAGLIFQATASGDVDPGSGSFPTEIFGDTSIQFTVPEPASLSLLGLGLLGTRFALRRRRQRQAN